jgi:hypothetical protein
VCIERESEKEERARARENERKRQREKDVCMTSDREGYVDIIYGVRVCQWNVLEPCMCCLKFTHTHSKAKKKGNNKAKKNGMCWSPAFCLKFIHTHTHTHTHNTHTHTSIWIF